MIRRSPRRAFTLLEATIAAAIVSIMLAAALNAAGRLGMSSRTLANRSIARSLAEDLLTEIADRPYTDPESPYQAIGPDDNDSYSLPDRSGFDDVDDYDQLKDSPPTDRAGKTLNLPAGWARTVSVAWVNPSKSLADSPSETRVKRVTVTVFFAGKPLASLTAYRSEALDLATR